MFRSGLKITFTAFSFQCFRKSSALYVTKDKATEIYSVVVPYLDCDERFKDLNKLQENIQKRQLNMNINEIKELWEFYKQWSQSKEIIERKRVEVAVEMKKVSNITDDKIKEKEIIRLKLQGKFLKEDLKDINKTVWGIEDIVILQALSLPNDLHPKVPTSETVLKELKSESEIRNGNHLIVGKSLNCIDYHNVETYYLKNDAVQFEIAVGSFFKNYFKIESFIPFVNSDFAKSVLVEGVSMLPINHKNALLLKDTDEGLTHKLHLTGGASLFSFCAFHSKQTIISDSLPAKYITIGRGYNPTPVSNLGGLYSTWQCTVANIFIALGDDDNRMDSEFDKTLELLLKIYKTLDMNFRIVNQPAKVLEPWESLRTSIQLYSQTNETFVEVAHLSIIDNFISKRLRLCYTDQKQERFLKLISGIAVNIPVLLALCLERSGDTLFFPEVIKKFKVL